MSPPIFGGRDDRLPRPGEAVSVAVRRARLPQRAGDRPDLSDPRPELRNLRPIGRRQRAEICERRAAAGPGRSVHRAGTRRVRDAADEVATGDLDRFPPKRSGFLASAHIHFGKPASTFPGYALADLDISGLGATLRS